MCASQIREPLRYPPRNPADKIREFGGYKILFIQNEYRWVDRTVAAVLNLVVHQIYSVVNKEVIDKIYHHPSIRHLRHKSVLTDYVPEDLTRRPVPAYSGRNAREQNSPPEALRVSVLPRTGQADAVKDFRTHEAECAGYLLALSIVHKRRKGLC
jgi:hypothetical protein